jgi:serine/threonine protein phosphatase PrpC
MRFVTASLSSKHERALNEDYSGYFVNDDIGCWVVADGLGGHFGGEIASRMAVENILFTFQANQDCSQAMLFQYLERAHDTILARQAAEPELSGMRTTVVLLLADPLGAIWGHLGDSRLYQFRQRRIIFQTKDHSVPQALVNAGDLKPEEIRFHEDRHHLLRVLGQDGDFRPAILPARSFIEDGDAFLLCTDGFWEFVLETEMEDALAKGTAPQEWLDFMEQDLLSRALQDTGREHDNYTAMAIFIRK